MKCPFCDAQMQQIHDEYFLCPGGGPLLLEGRECPQMGALLNEAEITAVAIALIDAEMD